MTATIFALGVLGLSCDGDVVAEVVGASFGEPCDGSGSCISPLLCIDNVCLPPGDRTAGEGCTVGGDCVDGLTCQLGFCTAAGAGGPGSPCALTTDCQAGLRCGGGSEALPTCIEPGEGYVGESCASGLDCLDGLVCDPESAACATGFSPPFGESCTSDADCDPTRGFVCTSSGACGGLGPDGAPVPPWTGARCESSPDGTFGVEFELVEASSDDFFRLPFPNDGRRSASGLNLAGFPRPPANTASGTIAATLLDAAEDDATGFGNGFGPNQAVFMRFSAPPVFCGFGCGEDGAPATEDGCMGTGEAEPTVYVVDLTKNAQDEFFGFNNGLAFFWRASTVSQAYLCGPWIAIRPEFNPQRPDLRSRWTPGHTYFVFVRNRVRGCDGTDRIAATVDPNFTAMLGSTAPADPALATLWQAHAALREWLASSPTFPGTGGTVTGGDVLGGALFTVRDPSAMAAAVSAVAAAVDSTAIGALVDCGAADADDSCSSDPAFREYQGEIDLRSVQTPEAGPDPGGAVEIDAGMATVQGTVSVRFALSVPVGSVPVDGWPTVIYAHGTGGNARSHLVDGTAALLADRGLAVLGIEQVGHGVRGKPGVDPELSVFNVQNPEGTRGNFLQSAGDQLQLARSIPAFSAALEAAFGLSSPALDPARVYFLGHSQGASAVALAAPVQDAVSTVVLSGGGGLLLETLDGKTSPFNLKDALRAVFSDPRIDDIPFHPLLNVLQGYFADIDPVNFAPLLAREPLDGRAGKNVLHLIGLGDTYTPNDAGLAFARGLGGVYADSDDTQLPAPSESIAAPGDFPLSATEATRTVVTSIHAPASGEDGHFVLFEDGGKAGERAAEFFASDVSIGDPRVVE